MHHEYAIYRANPRYIIYTNAICSCTRVLAPRPRSPGWACKRRARSSYTSYICIISMRSITYLIKQEQHIVFPYAPSPRHLRSLLREGGGSSCGRLWCCSGRVSCGVVRRVCVCRAWPVSLLIHNIVVFTHLVLGHRIELANEEHVLRRLDIRVRKISQHLEHLRATGPSSVRLGGASSLRGYIYIYIYMYIYIGVRV